MLYSKNEPTSCKTKIIKEPSQISVSFCEYKKYPICCSLILSSCYNIKNFLFLTINSWWLTWCSCLVIPRMLEAGGGGGAKELISRDGDTVRWWGRVGRVSFPAYRSFISLTNRQINVANSDRVTVHTQIVTYIEQIIGRYTQVISLDINCFNSLLPATNYIPTDWVSHYYN